ncbi:MAG: hypothetical protein E7628_01175 [Ruminococcaceae bacterium]|nr:hypothetical protein [Oscillospiraceae bacterium]
MKYTRLILLTLIAIFLTTSVEGAEHSYSGSNTGEYAAKTEWDNLITALPDDIKNEIDDIDPYSPENAVTSVREKSSMGYWFSRAWDAVNDTLHNMFPSVLPVFSLVLLLAAAKMMLPDLSVELSENFLMLGRLAVAISLFKITFGILESAQIYLSNICKVMNLLTPVMQAVYLAEGSLTRLSVSTTAVMITVNAVGFVNTRVMAPCTTVLLALSAVSRICDDVKLVGLTAGIRNLIMRIWQIVTIMFSFMLGTQSVIASSADNLAAKTVKFAIGSFIPMAGGVMAEAYNTVKEGLSFVKTTAGIGGIIIILLLLIPGIIPLVVYKLSVIILSSLAVMLKLDGISELFDEVKGIVEIITAIVLYTSLMLVFAIILFTKSQV